MQAAQPRSVRVPFFIRVIGVVGLIIALGWVGTWQYWFSRVGTTLFIQQMNDMMQVRDGQNSPFGALSGTGDLNQRQQREFQNSLTRGIVGESTRHVWSLLTMFNAAWIGGSGMALILVGRRRRLAPGLERGFLTLTTVLSLLTLGALVGHHMRINHADGEWEVLSWSEVLWPYVIGVGGGIVKITQYKYAWLTYIVLFVAMFSSFGRAAARRDARLTPWLRGGITASIVGTLVTLGSIGILLRFVKLEPMPGHYYAIIAFTQSLWCWILMFAMLYLPDELTSGAIIELGTARTSPQAVVDASGTIAPVAPPVVAPAIATDYSANQPIEDVWNDHDDSAAEPPSDEVPSTDPADAPNAKDTDDSDWTPAVGDVWANDSKRSD